MEISLNTLSNFYWGVYFFTIIASLIAAMFFENAFIKKRLVSLAIATFFITPFLYFVIMFTGKPPYFIKDLIVLLSLNALFITPVIFTNPKILGIIFFALILLFIFI